LADTLPENRTQSQVGQIVFAVWTRLLDGQPMAGRLRTAQSIRQAISVGGAYDSAVMPSILSHRTFGRTLRCAWTLLRSLLVGRPLPLQCLLFASEEDVDAMCLRIPRTGVVYLDGIRLYALAERLRRERPSQRIVMDFDDLLWRRSNLLLKSRQPLSPGYLVDELSPIVRGLFSLFNRWILLYERSTLRIVERRALSIADAVVLVSELETQVLRDIADDRSTARLYTIPPSVETVQPPPPAFDRVERFIFVGTDGLTQNRLTIDHLVQLWGRHKPPTPLVLFGKQWRTLSLPEGVTAAGYVDSLADIYDPRSVLLAPSFVSGGIKTKVLESFAYRTPVVGNSETFEALELEGYPLLMDDERLLELVMEPNRFAPILRQAADQGYACVQSRHTPKVFADRWRSVIALPTEAEHALSGETTVDRR
jgi:hypothetical protein